jgi:hypothetical protein
MPTIQTSGAILSLLDPNNWTHETQHSKDSMDLESSDSEPDEDGDIVTNRGPFSWPAWQAITGIMHPIFSPEPNAGTPEAWRSVKDSEAVWAFVITYWELSQTDKFSFIVCKLNDCNARGRILYLDWFKVEWPKWFMNKRILSSLSEHSVDPYSVLGLPGNTRVRAETQPAQENRV